MDNFGHGNIVAVLLAIIAAFVTPIAGRIGHAVADRLSLPREDGEENPPPNP